MAKKTAKEIGEKLSLRDRLLKNTISEYAAPIEESEVYDKRWIAPTAIPLLNVAISGKLNSGVQPGLTTIAGPSKHFKTGFLLEMAKAFQLKFPEGIVIFYDSEFGSPPAYFKSRGIDMARVIHVPVTNIEELQFEIVAQLTNIERGDPVFIAVDSVGNLASKKEKEDMEKGESKTDMTRAKAYKSFYRVITPLINLKSVSMYQIAHTYKTMEMFAKDIVSGGTGIYLSSDNVWIIGRAQEKDGKNVEGYNFKINIDKSRAVKEKSKFEIEVRWDTGINKWSGLLDLALEGKFIKRPTLQSYVITDDPTQKLWKVDDISTNNEVWTNLLQNQAFVSFVENKYAVPEEQFYTETEATKYAKEVSQELEDTE